MLIKLSNGSYLNSDHIQRLFSLGDEWRVEFVGNITADERLVITETDRDRIVEAMNDCEYDEQLACGYCMYFDTKPIVDNSIWSAKISPRLERLEIRNKNIGFEYPVDDFDIENIHYCPMCGRKL